MHAATRQGSHTPEHRGRAGTARGYRNVVRRGLEVAVRDVKLAEEPRLNLRTRSFERVRGRRFREVSLNRAIVVLTVAAWQAFAQDLLASIASMGYQPALAQTDKLLAELTSSATRPA